MPTIARLLCSLCLYLVALCAWLVPFILRSTHDGWMGAVVFAVIAMVIMPTASAVDETLDRIKNDPRSKA